VTLVSSNIKGCQKSKPLPNCQKNRSKASQRD